MQNIAVCIPTYKRPDLLSKTLKSIDDNDLSNSDIARVDIIVVDNDEEKTAEAVVQAFKESSKAFFQVKYFNYPKKGLVNVRNELLERAIALNPHFIVFIDDDEYASSNWLKELVKTAIEKNADIAAGPVQSIFEKPVPAYLTQWFKKPESLGEQPIDTFASNNLILRTDFLSKTKLRFDPRFNTTGAEDTYFGIQANKAGAKIYWANDALVYEIVFENRATLNWLIKRRYRGAITFTYILKLERRYLQLLKKLMLSVAYLLSGGLGLILLPSKSKFKYWGILKMVEGYGGLAGLFNFKYHEYK